MNLHVRSRRESNHLHALVSIACGLGLAIASYGASTTTAHSLSEIQREQIPPPTTQPEATPGADETVPLPDPINPATPSSEFPEDQAPAQEQTPGDQQAPDADNAGSEADGPLPEIQYDLSTLPEPVQRTRSLILDAARSGDIEKLRPLIGLGDAQTQLSLGGIDGDPIKYLQELSGDEQGQEILAIIEEVLSAGYVHMEPGTANDFYVWPYFFAIPLDHLTAPQRVELFKIVTAGDYEDMKTYGAYIFYRVGITPDGKWSFFIAGD
ncbi:hypothetical protein [Arvimicrobium flavum]|uniref:hypothetical protein n=1 Tax=Arvimicrobium flavum TaxID=3393320 RepID=UPI00237AD7FB|nr:hypothetical protein [Mesorhizobium shangrilense]